ncbi:hypothetical protein [Candidatus Vallotiella sp. (ex Adelges kitamiensis)]|uniref:hypothetical protein n=1 Tax=Candidatus Vallotiella sp. (ex Adelges kitamiensis) TaxID=2864217 RepID=UPI001CE35927|nr:hypothetical protein [Candidatus Vallotia sp. (ex Adelges kitamiensis)]
MYETAGIRDDVLPLDANSSHAMALPSGIGMPGADFVKFWKALSTRHDLLPMDITIDLSSRRNQVLLFDSAVEIALIKHSLGQLVDVLSKSLSKYRWPLLRSHRCTL